MKASELITLLQDAIDKYGDLPLHTIDTEMNKDFDPLFTVVDGEGYSEEQERFIEAFEIWISPSNTYS